MSFDELKEVRSDGKLGLFVREMVGLDREAAKRAFDGFLIGKTMTANQIQFIDLVINYLTQSGWMTAAQLYESPVHRFQDNLFSIRPIFDSNTRLHRSRVSGSLAKSVFWLSTVTVASALAD